MMPSADPGQRWRAAILRLKDTANTHKGVRAVHKPLLTLMLISRAERGLDSRLTFEELEDELASLLRRFGPPRKSFHPEYPFWHLQTNGFWKVDQADRFELRKQGNSPARSTLKRGQAAGRVPEALWRALTRDARLRSDLAHAILDDFWPPTLHEDILAATGIVVATAAPELQRASSRRKRDPRFAAEVLRAYERRCAVCGYDAQLSTGSFGLEAAHVKWHCEGGPDEVANGLALCSLHHKAFDVGAIGLSDDHRVHVSSDVSGGDVATEMILRFSGATLRGPQPGMPRIGMSFIGWHREQVFRKPERTFNIPP